MTTRTLELMGCGRYDSCVTAIQQFGLLRHRSHLDFQLAPWTRTGLHPAPRRYLACDIADGIIWPLKKGIESLSPTYLEALKRWNQGVMGVFDYPFDLQATFDTFDDVLFCKTLGSRTHVQWVDSDPEGANRAAFTDDLPGSETDALICIVRRQHATPRNVIVTLLQEMVHATFTIFKCRCDHCQCTFWKACGEEAPKYWHGPGWRRLGQAIEEEANRSLHGLEGPWNLDVGMQGPSQCLDIEELIDLVEKSVLCWNSIPMKCN